MSWNFSKLLCVSISGSFSLGPINERNLSPIQFRFIPGICMVRCSSRLGGGGTGTGTGAATEAGRGRRNACRNACRKQRPKRVFWLSKMVNRTYVGSKETGMSHLKVGRFLALVAVRNVASFRRMLRSRSRWSHNSCQTNKPSSQHFVLRANEGCALASAMEMKPSTTIVNIMPPERG